MACIRIQAPIYRLSVNVKSLRVKRRARQTWVTGFSILIFSGNCAFVTRKVEIRLRWSSSTSELISGYMIGSPTRERAQCLGESPSIKRSVLTPIRNICYCQLQFIKSNNRDETKSTSICSEVNYHFSLSTWLKSWIRSSNYQLFYFSLELLKVSDIVQPSNH